MARRHPDLLNFILKKKQDSSLTECTDLSSDNQMLYSNEPSSQHKWPFKIGSDIWRYKEPSNQSNTQEHFPVLISPFNLNPEECTLKILDNMALMTHEPIKSETLNNRDSTRNDREKRASCLRTFLRESDKKAQVGIYYHRWS